ncbi:MAG: TlpA family protein disulfide reductase [Candidatus Latescibacteria bacterium]|nr:TlpA family protein disulfide reductase [Candidatus Latescibacterota bacterium]
MRHPSFRLLGMMLGLLAVTGLAGSSGAGEAGKTIGTEIGQYAPNFQVYTMNGEKVTLEDYKGKLLFVNFWAWWCPPCRDEAEALMNLEKRYAGRVEFAYVGVERFWRDKKSLDPKEVADGLRPELNDFIEGTKKTKFVKPDSTVLKAHPERAAEYGARNQAVIDHFLQRSFFDFRGYWERQFRAQTNEKYGIPVTYLIDRDGKIKLAVHPNKQNWDRNDDIMDDFVAGRDLTKYQSRFPIPPELQRKPATAAGQ